MTYEEHKAITKNSRELEDMLAVPVKLSHGEAFRLVVNDLVGKYKFSLERRDSESAAAYEAVLLLGYVTEEELTELLK